MTVTASAVIVATRLLNRSIGRALVKDSMVKRKVNSWTICIWVGWGW